MKIELIDAEEAPIEGDVVYVPSPIFRLAKIDWAFVVRLVGLSGKHKNLSLSVKSAAKPWYCPWFLKAVAVAPVKAPSPHPKAHEGDNPQRVKMSPWALTRITISARPSADVASERTLSILLVPKAYRYLVLGLLSVVGLPTLYWRRELLWDELFPGSNYLLRAVLLAASAVAPLFASLGGTKLIEIVIAQLGFLRSSAQGERKPRLLLLQPFLVSLVAGFLMMLLPAGFSRVKNVTDGTPTIQGVERPLERDKPVLVWSPLSSPILAESDSGRFTMAPKDTEDFWKRFEPREYAIECKASHWQNADCPDGLECGDGLHLQQDRACNIEPTQQLDWVWSRSVEDAKPKHLAPKPFSGTARFEINAGDTTPSDATLKCQAPAETRLVFYSVKVLSRAPLGEMLIECRKDIDTYELVSHLLPNVSKSRRDPPAPTDPPMPICLPEDAVDCRLSLNASSGVQLKLHKELLQKKKIELGESASRCDVGYEDEQGDAIVSTLAITGPQAADVTLISGVCKTRLQIPENGTTLEVTTIAGERSDLELLLQRAAVGTRLHNALLFRAPTDESQRKIGIDHGTHRSDVLCEQNADTLLLVDAKEIGVGKTITSEQKLSATSFREGSPEDEQTVVWLCAQNEPKDEADGKRKPARFKADREQQCATATLKVSSDPVWIERFAARPTLKLCHPAPPQCCHVCLQTRGDIRRSAYWLVGSCAEDPSIGSWLPGPASCGAHRIRETLRCP